MHQTSRGSALRRPPCGRLRAGTVAVALAFFGLLVAAPLLRAQPLAAPYSIDQWQTDQGLPQNSVTAIVQTRDGYLWLGTYNGLVRFDGLRFTTLNPRNTPELGSARVTSLYEDAAGALWIGNESGALTRYSGGRFTFLPPAKNAPEKALIGLAETADHQLRALNSLGWVLAPTRPAIPGRPGGGTEENSASLARTSDGRAWLIGGNELRELRADGLHTPPNAPPPTNYIERACGTRAGGLWLAGAGGLRQWTAGGGVVDYGPAPWGTAPLTALLETQGGDLVAGTLNQGLFIRRPDGTTWHCDRHQGLAHDWVRCLAEDREGTLWVGTGGALNALRPRRIQMVAAPDDWQGRAVLSVTPRKAGGLWVATEGAGLYSVSGTAFQPFDQSHGLSNLFVWCVLEDRHQQLWVGTWGGGLFTGADEHTLQPAPGLTNTTVPMTALYEARDGALWIGTQAGLIRYEAGRTTWYTRTNGLARPDVRTITEGTDGSLWFGMAGGGLGRLLGGRLLQYHPADGLPSDFVWCLYPEPDGDLWVGTFGGGLARFHAGRFQTLSTRQGLPHEAICHLADDGLGYAWMSSGGGIFRARWEDLRAGVEGRLPRVPCLAYGRADGLATLDCSGGCQPAGNRTADGRLWFPTSKGLAVVDPAQVKLNPLPPPVVVEELRVDDQPWAAFNPTLTGPDARWVIPPGKQRFQFRYTGLSLRAPDKLRFRYRLVGLEPDWVEAGDRRSVDYSYLRPGEYTFRVLACNSDGVWNEAGASVGLVVRPYYWQTWWFAGALLLGGIAGVAVTVRAVTHRRYRRRLEGLERQRAVERERSRIARDIHDDLGASLTRITLLSQPARRPSEPPDPSAANLQQIYQTARQLTRAMDEIVWAVSPQHDSLDSLAAYLGKFAQDFLSGAGLRCRLQFPLELPARPVTAEVRHNLYLALKEALHNVLKHARATEVRVALEPAADGFTLVASDNGCGFDPRQAPTATAPDRPAAGRGLANMRQRLAEIGGNCTITSAPGEGTQVRFHWRAAPAGSGGK